MMGYLWLLATCVGAAWTNHVAAIVKHMHCSDCETRLSYVQVIARGTPGFSGADLANLVNLAALKAAQDGKSVVGMGALEYARERIMMGAERKGAVLSEKTRRVTAYHEGGHAIVAMLTPGADPVHKATIIPRGTCMHLQRALASYQILLYIMQHPDTQCTHCHHLSGMALGMVQQLPDEDQVSQTKKQLLARLNVLMGGKAAEELIEGVEEVSTGVAHDLEQATKLARAMVTKCVVLDEVFSKVDCIGTGCCSAWVNLADVHNDCIITRIHLPQVWHEHPPRTAVHSIQQRAVA